MSQTKVQLVGDISGNVSGGASFTGIVTAASFVGDGSGLINVAGGGGGLGTAITYDDGGASPFSYIDKVSRVTSDLNMTNVNAGASDSYIVSVSPNIVVEAGVGVTVGAGKTMIIDVLKIGDL